MKHTSSWVKSHPLIILLIIAFVLRLTTLFFTHIYLEPNYFIDISRYDSLSLAKAEEWHGGEPIDISKVAGTKSLGFYYWIASIYFLFGHVPLLIKLFNVILGSLVPVVIYLIAEKIFSKKIALLSAGLTAIFPSMIFWSTIMLKDMIVVLLSSLLIYLAINLGYAEVNKNFLLLLCMGILTFILVWSREYIAVILAVSILFYIFLKFTGSLNISTILRFKLPVLVILFFFLGTALSLAGYGFFGINIIKIADLERIDDIRSRMAGGSSDFATEVSINTLGKTLSYLPIGILYFLFSPFPWKTAKFLEQLMMPEMILFYILSPFMIYGIYYSLRYKFNETNLIILFVLANIILYSLVEVNLGTLVRHRIQSLPYLFMLGFAGIVRVYEKINLKKSKGARNK